MINIETWKGSLNNIVDFYKTCNYKYYPNDKDTILVAKDNDRIVGVIRFSKENGVLHLRGMQITQQSRRQGVGTLLLEKSAKIIGGETCYLVGYPHLTNFYEQIGFREIKRSEAQKSVQERYDNAKRKFPDTKFNIMVRK